MGDVPMDGHIQLLPGIVRRDVGKVRHRLQILISQSLGHSHPLPVHRQSQLRRRRGKAVLIQKEIHIRPLDAAGVHQTGPRMQGRVHQRQAAGYHIPLQPADVKQIRLEPGQQVRPGGSGHTGHVHHVAPEYRYLAVPGQPGPIG